MERTQVSPLRRPVRDCEHDAGQSGSILQDCAAKVYVTQVSPAQIEVAQGDVAQVIISGFQLSHSHFDQRSGCGLARYTTTVAPPSPLPYCPVVQP